MKTVLLHGKKAADRVALVDDEDYDLVMQYRWRISERIHKPARRPDGPYALTQVTRNHWQTVILMHNLIMGAKGIDHIDHDGLNNQRYNLRPADLSQNQANRRPTLTGTSPYKGVSWSRQRRLWHAAITVRGSRRHLGEFSNEENAALAYNAAALEAFGSYACLNEIPRLRDGAA